MPRLTGTQLLAWAVSVGIAGHLLLGPVAPEQPGLAFWLAGGVALEVLAPRLGTFGFLTTAPSLSLALAWSSPKAAILLLWGSICLRTLLRGSSRLAMRPLEALSDLVPASLAIGLGLFLRSPVAGSLTFLVAWSTLPGLLASSLEMEQSTCWARYRQAIRWSGLAPVWASWLLSTVDLRFALTLLLLAQLERGGADSVALVNATLGKLQQREVGRELVQQRVGLDEMEDNLFKVGEQQRKSASDLQVRLETYTLVEQMLESLTGQPALEVVARSIVERVRARLRSQSVVLFWLGQGEFKAVAYRTPYEDRIKASELMRTCEPVVARAHKLQRIERMLPEDRGLQRMFPEETCTMAVPMGAQGVLYLGHPKPLEVGEDQLHFLRVLSTHAVLALQAAALFGAQKEALKREADAASRNVVRVQRLAVVIDTVTELVKLNQPQEMLEATGVYLERLIPHDYRFLVSEDCVSVAGKAAAEEACRSLTRVVQENGVPLLLEHFKGSRFQRPTPMTRTLLCVPLLVDQGPVGAMLIAREAGAVFTREDQDILSVLAYQLGAALHAARLYQQLDEAHHALKESQAQLVQSSKMAAIGQLAGGVAHELNTPLGAIALAVDGALVTLRNKPDRAESRLTRAAGSVQQMKQIVSKLLFYSRDARSGRRETDLNEVIEDTLQLIEHQLTLDNVVIERDFGMLPLLLANQNELQQICTNLLVNARDAVMDSGASQRKILVQTFEDGDDLVLGVRDWGCGMSEQVRERIFEPFYTTKEVGKGTGLGLSVTVQLIEQHSGQIEVESVIGEGTQFWLRLPRAAAEVE